MDSEKRIELSLGQEPGEFRLSVDGITIVLNLKTPAPGRALPQAIPAPKAAAATALPEIPAAGGAVPGDSREAQLSAEADYYRRLSQEIYEGLGKLSKELNLSIQDLSLAEIIQTGMSSPGERLDQARSQVADVLQMTEQATLDIMNLVEEIREDCQTVQVRLLKLAQPGEAEGDGGEDGSSQAGEADQAVWSEVLSRAAALDRLLGRTNTPEASPSAGAASLFPLSEVLQLLLEFCANETVKQHLKAVQAKQEAIFRTAEAEEALSLLASEAPQEDGFYQLPVGDLLEILKGRCEDDRVKELFNKMTSSAKKLFPISALPLEARSREPDLPQAPDEVRAPTEVEALWGGLHEKLKSLAESQTAVPGRQPGEKSETAAAVKEVLGTVDRITMSLSRIIEALSFQDLSGQRLLKVLKIIRQLQVQVLTLLVGVGQKLQGKSDPRELSSQVSSQAREGLDRLLHTFFPPPTGETSPVETEQSLDQNAVNDILTSMGF